MRCLPFRLLKVPRNGYLFTRLWQLRAARAAWGAPAGGSAGVAGAHKFTEGDYFLFPFRRVSRLVSIKKSKITFSTSAYGIDEGLYLSLIHL